MDSPEDHPAHDSHPDTGSPFTEIRYSLPELLREVIRDRASRAFAMEKLDQPSITTLFEQQQLRNPRDPEPRH